MRQADPAQHPAVQALLDRQSEGSLQLSELTNLVQTLGLDDGAIDELFELAHERGIDLRDDCLQSTMRVRVLEGRQGAGATLPAAVEVVHQIPSRIRLRLPPELLGDSAQAGISAVLDRHPHIVRHRFSRASRSLVIEHDQALLPYQIGRLVEAAEPTSHRNGTAGKKSVSEWLALGLGGALALSGHPLAVPVLTAAAMPIFRRGLESLLRHRKFNVDVLDSLALCLTFAGGHMVTAGAVIAMVEGGEWMRDATAARSRRALGELIADRNAVVWKVVGDHRVEVRVSELRAGDMVAVAPGDHIPVDGVVHRGTAAVDERFMTGEPVPVRRSVGDRVYAMTVVGEGELMILADSDVQHSRAGRIVEFLEQAPIGDTRMSDQARRVGDRFVLPVLGLGGVILAATGSPSRTASVITFDLVTGIRVSAPTTMLASLTAAARRGTLIKGAAALESLAQIDAIVFDKTGTLTAGTPSVVAVNSFFELGHDDLLRIAASADHSVRHPLATALCTEAEARGTETAALLRRDYHIGLGVEAQLADGHRYLVGNRLLMQQHGVQLARLPPELHSYADTSRVWIAEPPRCLGVVLMRDLQRPEASAAVAALRTRGVRHMMLLSGDSEGAARGIAESLGLDEWRARATPEGKAEVVQELQKKGLRVAVVGDGINDSLAFSMADVGIAMGGGSDIASSTAQVVLIDDDLSLLPRAIDGARQAVRLMRQNLALIAVPNLVGLIFALLVPMSPAVAGLLSNGSTILAATNGLRPLNGATATKPAAASSTSRG